MFYPLKNVFIVKEQEEPDSSFSTVDYPNPEDVKVFVMAQELAAKDRMKRSEQSVFTSQGVKATYLELNKGDMVQHTAFGRGMVLSVVKMGGDALLEIAFDDIGTKKLMAKTASAHMKKL